MSNKNQNRPVAIKINGVKKMYKLGQIGGGTLRADMQSWWARARGKEDPNTKIGEGQRSNGETFMALNGIDLTIYQGEAIGIIGSNGAGKSTLLKLLSLVTAPSEGDIDIYGRIASMLEVGTGFNGEMTGRENVYMNGAILGMTKAEIDAKMEDIIEFSEVREFIDTPVKRYSSGMYVKLAFSVAAHLDSEIMIMDEVLAVGDMAFQTKCLDKMREAAEKEGRTILYVSHNMNTIRRLCERCIVLDRGKIIFNGDVEDAIEIYLGANNVSKPKIDLGSLQREQFFDNGPAKMTELEIQTDNSVFEFGDHIKGQIGIIGKKDIRNVIFTIILKNNGVPVLTSETEPKIELVKEKKTTVGFQLNLLNLAPGKYNMKLMLSIRNGEGGVEYLDVLMDTYFFEIKIPKNFRNGFSWNSNYNGFFVGNKIELLLL